MTPDVIRNTIVGADRSITDFRIVQVAPDTVRLTLPVPQAASIPAATVALLGLFRRLGARPRIHAEAAPLASPQGGKLRRVICQLEAAP